jgi:hypothetical protein
MANPRSLVGSFRCRTFAVGRRSVVVAVVTALLASLLALAGATEASATELFATATPRIEPLASPAVRRSGFQPLVPARLLDTRTGTATIDGIGAGGGPVGPGTSIDVLVAGRGGVPTSGAAAAVVNVTIVDPDRDGFLTVFPAGIPVPTASNMNYRTGDTIANQAVVGLNSAGSISIYVGARAFPIVDVVGWIDETSSAGIITPTRVADSRVGGATIDGRLSGFGALGTDRSIDITVAGRGNIPTSGVGSVILSVTVVDASAAGFVTVHPAGTERPTASSVNFAAGGTVANQVISSVSDLGKVSIYTSAQIDLIVDIVGWLPLGSDLSSQTPARLYDTRPSSTTFDGLQSGGGPVAGGAERRVNLAGRSSIPASGFGSVVLNITAVGPSAAGYLSVYPAGAERPNASSLNFAAGQTRANLAIAKVGDGGDIVIFTSATTDVIVDVVGWIPPGLNEPDPRLVSFGSPSLPVGLLSGGPGTGSARLVVPTASTAKVDDLVAVMTDSGKPYYGVITATAVGYVDTKEVPLSKILPNVDLKLEGDANNGQVTQANANGVPVGSIDGPATRSLVAPRFSIETGIQPKGIPCKGSGVGDVEVQPTVDPAHFVFDVDWGITGVNSARIGYNPRFGLEANISLGAGVSCTATLNLLDKKLPTIKFTIGIVPVVIENTLTADLEFTVSASGSVVVVAGFQAEAFVGVVYDNGWRFASEANFSKTWRTKAQVDISVGASLPIGLEMEANGIVSLNIAVEPSVTATLSPLQDRWIAVEAQVDASATLGVKLDFKFFKWSAEIELARATLWGPEVIYERRRSTDLNIDASDFDSKLYQNLPFSATFNVTGGQNSSSWNWTGESLPPGLEVTSTGRTARISGSPTVPGTYFVRLIAEEAPLEEDDFVHDPASQDLVLRVVPALALATTSLPVGEQGVALYKTIVVRDGKGPYTLGVGGLPAGLSFTTNSGSNVGLISGTPTGSGPSSIRITATDSIGSPPVDSTLSLSIAAPVVIDNPIVPGGSIGVPYSVTHTASNGVPPYRWNAAGMPPGIVPRIEGANGERLVLSGVPTSNNPFALRVSAVDALNVTTASSGGTGIVYPRLELKTGSIDLPLGSVDWLRSDGALEVSGGKAPYNWTVTGLPSGVSFDASQHGRVVRLTGPSTAAGSVSARVQLTDAAGSLAIDQNVTITTSQLLRFVTTSLPNGAVSAPYSATIELAGDGNPTSWRVLNLPAGLTLGGSATDKVRTLSGTPTVQGAYELKIYISDGSTRPDRVATFPVRFAPPLRMTTTDLGGALVDVGYTRDLSVTDGQPPYTWTVTGLPNGVTFTLANPTAATRTISGSATAAGSNSVRVQVSDSVGSPALDQTFPLPVAADLLLNTAGIGAVGYTTAPAYSGTVASTGGHAPVRYSAVGLPTGLTLDTSTGAVTGIPTTAGSSVVTFTTTDAKGFTRSVAASIAVSSPPTISIANVATTTLTGDFYAGQPTATGGVPSITWSATGLPAWASINASTGRISGTPSDLQAGTSTITVTATDAGNRTTSAIITLVVQPTPLLVLSITLLPTTIQAGNAYSGTPTISGGRTPYTWSISGSPSWMTFNTSTGAVGGTPAETQGGTSTITITAVDDIGRSASKTLILTVTTTPLPVSVSSVPTTATAGIAYSGTPTVTGGTAPYAWTINGQPAWMTISVSTGAMSGTPGSADGGTSSITVTVTDATGRTGSASFSLATQALTVQLSGVPTGATLGEPYSGTVSQTNGTAPFAYSATGLPAWATLNASTGAISGTPPATGYEATIPVTFTVTDRNSASASGFLSLSVTKPIDIGTGWAQLSSSFTVNTTVTTPRRVAWIIGGRFDANPTVTVSGLPTGLTGQQSSDYRGVYYNVTGTPSSPGTSQVTMTVTDLDGRTASKTFPIQVIAPTAITFDGSSAFLTRKSGTNRFETIRGLRTTGGVGPFTYRVDASSVPAGITFSPWNPDSLDVSGTPSSTGNFTVNWTITDADGTTAPGSSRMVVYDRDVIVDASTLPTTINQRATVSTDVPSASGGLNYLTPTFTWSSPDLPTGLTIDAQTGAISGSTSAAAGQTSATIIATDDVGLSGSATWTFTTNETLAIDTTGFKTQVNKRAYFEQQLPTDVTWTVTGLPFGLTYDAASHKVIGNPVDQSPTSLVARAHTVQLSGTKNGVSGSTSFTITVADRSDVSSVSAGKDYSCASFADGKVKCWGATAGGRLGRLFAGTPPASAGPDYVTDTNGDPLTGVTAVWSSPSIYDGEDYSCAVAAGGQVYCWGTTDSTATLFGVDAAGVAISQSNTAIAIHVRSDDAGGAMTRTAVTAHRLALTGLLLCGIRYDGNHDGWCIGTGDTTASGSNRKNWASLGTVSPWVPTTGWTLNEKQLVATDDMQVCSIKSRYGLNPGAPTYSTYYGEICEGFGPGHTPGAYVQRSGEDTYNGVTGPASWRIAGTGGTLCRTNDKSLTQSQLNGATAAITEAALTCFDVDPQGVNYGNHAGQLGYAPAASSSNVAKSNVSFNSTPVTYGGNGLKLASTQYVLAADKLAITDAGGCAVAGQANADPPASSGYSSGGLWCWGTFTSGVSSSPYYAHRLWNTGGLASITQTVVSSTHVLFVDSYGQVRSFGPDALGQLRGADPTATDVVGTMDI